MKRERRRFDTAVRLTNHTRDITNEKPATEPDQVILAGKA